MESPPTELGLGEGNNMLRYNNIPNQVSVGIGIL